VCPVVLAAAEIKTLLLPPRRPGIQPDRKVLGLRSLLRNSAFIHKLTKHGALFPTPRDYRRNCRGPFDQHDGHREPHQSRRWPSTAFDSARHDLQYGQGCRGSSDGTYPTPIAPRTAARRPGACSFPKINCRSTCPRVGGSCRCGAGDAAPYRWPCPLSIRIVSAGSQPLEADSCHARRGGSCSSAASSPDFTPSRTAGYFS
jgi:hypothetical protein